MKFTSVVLAVLYLISAQYSFAQSNKKRGFVVLNNRDSLYGWIDYLSIKRSPQQISFYKDSMADNPVKYSTADLSYFEMPGYNAYVKATVPASVSMYAVSPNSSSSEDTTISQSVWLRIIVAGARLSLYEWKNERSHFYVRENNGEYMEMQIRITADQGYERELPLYKNQLTAFAIKYGLATEALSRAIDNVRYDEDGLRKILIELNGNKSIVQYKTIRERSKWSWFINGGATLGALTLSGDKTYVGNLEFDQSVAPYFSLGVELSNFGVKRFALRLEMSYTAARYSGKGSSNSSSNNQVAYELEQRTITPAFSALYSFLQKKYVSLFGCVGMAYNFSSYKKNVWHQTFPELTLTDFADLKNKYIAASIKLGVRIIQKFEIGAGRQLFDDFIYQSSKYNFDHPTYNIWVGYRFK